MGGLGEIGDVPGGRGRLIALIGVLVLALGLGGFWLAFPSDRGVAEQPGRVLVVGSMSSDDAGLLDDLGFEATNIGFLDAEDKGRALDTDLTGIAAVLRYADERGFGYVVLSMTNADYDLTSSPTWGDAPEDLEGAQFVSLSVGDLTRDLVTLPWTDLEHELRAGAQVDGVEFRGVGGRRVGLASALFRQSVIDEIRMGERTAGTDFFLGLDRAQTFEYAERLDEYLSLLRELPGSWRRALGEMHAISKPFETTTVYPLAGGRQLVAARAGQFTATGIPRLGKLRGPALKLESGPLEFSMLPAGVAQRQQAMRCTELADDGVLHWEGVRVASDGRAVVLWRDGAAEVYTLRSGAGSCGFEKVGDHLAPSRAQKVGEPGAHGDMIAVGRSSILWWNGGRVRTVATRGFEAEPGPSSIRWVSQRTAVATGQAWTAETEMDPPRLMPALSFVEPGRGLVATLRVDGLLAESERVTLHQAWPGAEGQSVVMWLDVDGTAQLYRLRFEQPIDTLVEQLSTIWPAPVEPATVCQELHGRLRGLKAAGSVAEDRCLTELSALTGRSRPSKSQATHQVLAAVRRCAAQAPAEQLITEPGLCLDAETLGPYERQVAALQAEQATRWLSERLRVEPVPLEPGTVPVAGQPGSDRMVVRRGPADSADLGLVDLTAGRIRWITDARAIDVATVLAPAVDGVWLRSTVEVRPSAGGKLEYAVSVARFAPAPPVPDQ